MPLHDARLKAMAGSHYVALDVRYEPGVRDGTSLAWIAPELRDDGLDLIEDHLDEPKPSRIWAGCVDGPTFKRFATAWALDRSDEDFGRSEDRPCCERTFDGMNWEVDGVSPIISVSVRTHACGAPYADTAVLDKLRSTEYSRLDAGGHVYLDYTGGGLYARSQLREHFELLESDVFGNPHSINPTSAASSALVERARASVLEFFRASPDEYVAIFTPNATGALRLVGEAYPFHPGDRFLLTFDNHNSVNGIREFARARGAETTYIPSAAPDLRVDPALLPRYLTETIGDHHNLFAYPAQSNFSGVHHPLEWIEQAHAHGWDVMLDSAAFVPTNRLDLSVWHPDFVPISFYKMFGWPTGVGCLLARRQALAKLERPWFSGGTIVAAFVQRQYYQSAPGAAHFEDGTVNYLSLPAVEIGLRFLDRIGIDTIHDRVSALGDCCWTRWAPSATETACPPRPSTDRGPTGSVGRRSRSTSCTRTAGSSTSATSTVSRARTGSRCGRVVSAILGPERSRSRSRARRSSAASSAKGWRWTTTCGDRTASGGAVRASLGLVSNFADVHRFIEFADEFIDLASVPDDLPPRIVC